MTRTLSARPRALLFDFGGTLDAEGVPWKERFRRLWREEVGAVDPEAFDNAFYDADDALVGTIAPEAPLPETAHRLAAGLAQRLSPEDAAAPDRVASRFCAEAAACLCASSELLRELAGRYRLGVVSNFYGNLSAVCSEAGLAPLLSVAIDSAAIGVEKPDPRIFEAALSALGVPSSEALFVGDSPARDMAGARGVGMRHVLLAGGGAPPFRACCPGDPVIRRLADLKELLP